MENKDNKCVWGKVKLARPTPGIVPVPSSGGWELPAFLLLTQRDSGAVAALANMSRNVERMTGRRETGWGYGHFLGVREERRQERGEMKRGEERR